jgi:hypothetical protein
LSITLSFSPSTATLNGLSHAGRSGDESGTDWDEPAVRVTDVGIAGAVVRSHVPAVVTISALAVRATASADEDDADSSAELATHPASDASVAAAAHLPQPLLWLMGRKHANPRVWQPAMAGAPDPAVAATSS